MASKAGLKKVTKTVRGKKGAVRRSYWVKAKDAVKSAGGFLNRNKGKIALGAAAAIGTGLAIHRRLKIDRRQAETRASGVRGLPSAQKTHEEFQKTRESIGQVGQAFAKTDKSLRRAKALNRRLRSENRRVGAATRQVEKGNLDGASNIMNREAHKNLRKKRNTNLN